MGFYIKVMYRNDTGIVKIQNSNNLPSATEIFRDGRLLVKKHYQKYIMIVKSLENVVLDDKNM